MSLFGEVLFLGHTVWVVSVGELGPTWHLVVAIERVALAFGGRSLQESARLGT